MSSAGILTRTLAHAMAISVVSVFLIGSSVFGYNLFQWVDPVFPDTGLWSIVQLAALIGPVLITTAFWLSLIGGDGDE